MSNILKKLKKPIIAVLVIILVLTIYNFINTGNEEEVFIQEDYERSFYKIDCELDTEEKILEAKMELSYYNSDDIVMNEIYFHVYPNAFKDRETAPFLFDDFNNAYEGDFAPGYAEILSILNTDKNGERLLNYNFSGEGNTILKVEFNKPLQPYKRVDLNIDFKIFIPPAKERFGYGENHFNLGNWYPIVAVYDDKDGWNLDKYYPIGDPFFSDASDYCVSIKAPRDYIIAASGENTKKDIVGDNIIWEFKENSIRDFAFVANNKFEMVEKKLNGIKIKSYFYKGEDGRGKEALECGVKSIKLFNKLFGKYPYNEYSIVETVFPTGMEYPTLVYISDKLYKSDYGSDPLTITVVHETAHQWFYGIVGNDQIDEAWLDESFASYAETLYAEHVYGKKTGKEYYERTVEKSVQEALSDNSIDGMLSKSLWEFQGWKDYGPTAYDRGAQMLYELREMLGDDLFFKILRTYVNEYKFKIAYTEDFIKICEDVSGKNLSDFFAPWLVAH